MGYAPTYKLRIKPEPVPMEHLTSHSNAMFYTEFPTELAMSIILPTTGAHNGDRFALLASLCQAPGSALHVVCVCVTATGVSDWCAFH